MSTPKSLPILMPAIASQRWSCHSCGNCCRSLVGHLDEQDREKIDRLTWTNELGAAPYVRAGRSWVLNKRPDGACVFLDADNHCLIHGREGESAKPLACRIFPFSLRTMRHGWQASLRFDCPSVASAQGAPIGQYREWLTAVSRELEFAAPDGDDTALLARGLRATLEEEEAVIARFVRWFRTDELSLMDRLVGAAHVTATFQRAEFGKVRGNRFIELMDLLFTAAPSESAVIEPVATPRQRRLLRLLAFAHAEHVTLEELRSSLPFRMAKRWQQLRRARRLRLGRGMVPHWPEFAGDVSFESVESVHPARDGASEVAELLQRYVTTRLQQRSVFGHGYYGWRVFDGLAALWSSLAAVGWLARCWAAAGKSVILRFEDVARALGVVDRAATRVPALGTHAERARTVYLSQNEGVARLLRHYALTEEHRD